MSAFSQRAERLRARLPSRQVDLLVVSKLVNVRYLTGFTGTNGICVVGPSGGAFVTDFRYVEQAGEQVPDYELRVGKDDMLEAVAAAVRELGADRAGEHVGLPRLGFDDATITVRAHRRLGELLEGAAELVPAPGLVEELRAVKDAEEIDAIRRATALADTTYEWLAAEHGLAGHTERDAAFALEMHARELGAEAVAFPPIVAAGAHGALPHATPRDVEIPNDTLVVVDFGCTVDGYNSDCTRTFATGEVDTEARECYELVKAAQQTALERARAGADVREVDGAARELIERAGHGERFGHGVGHGVGLEVHEGPRLAPTANGRLNARNVVTIEPGVYLPERFGVRIEDLVVVDGDDPEILTTVSKDLTEV